MSKAAVASRSTRTHLKRQLHLHESPLGPGLNRHIGVVAAVHQLARGENGIAPLGLT